MFFFHNKRAYTLLEILIVLGIISALALLAVPSYNRFQAIQTFRQKAEESRSLIIQAYNMSQSPEDGVANYLVIPDHLKKKYFLVRQNEGVLNLDANADGEIDEGFIVKEIFLDEVMDSIQCMTRRLNLGTQTQYCGILYCKTEAATNGQNQVCDLKDPETDYYNLANDTGPSQREFTLRVADFSARKWFSVSDLSGSSVDKFETQGLRSIEGNIL